MPGPRRLLQQVRGEQAGQTLSLDQTGALSDACSLCSLPHRFTVSFHSTWLRVHEGHRSWEKGTANRRGRSTPGLHSHSGVSGLSSLTEQSYESFSSIFQSGMSPRSPITGPWGGVW